MIDITKAYGDVLVFNAFNARFPEHGFVGISGASGTGKTTLLRMIAGLEEPDAGSVEGVPGRVSVQFEDDRLFPWMDVVSNVTLVGSSPDHAASLLEELGLEGREHARIAELSGGQRRRVSLARSLAYPADLYLFDEPTARLDEENAVLVMNVIKRHCAGSLTVMASHDEQVLGACDMVFGVPPGD